MLHLRTRLAVSGCPTYELNEIVTFDSLHNLEGQRLLEHKGALEVGTEPKVDQMGSLTNIYFLLCSVCKMLRLYSI